MKNWKIGEELEIPIPNRILIMILSSIRQPIILLIGRGATTPQNGQMTDDRDRKAIQFGDNMVLDGNNHKDLHYLNPR